MSKQVEEMCEILRKNSNSCKICVWYVDEVCTGNCELAQDNQKCCETLYNAGYRKASEVARKIFEEIEEGVKAAISALQFENNPIHRKVKHETYSSLMRFIKSIEGKYLGEDNNVPTGYIRFEAKAIPATLNVKYTEERE